VNSALASSRGFPTSSAAEFKTHGVLSFLIVRVANGPTAHDAVRLVINGYVGVRSQMSVHKHFDAFAGDVHQLSHADLRLTFRVVPKDPKGPGYWMAGVAPAFGRSA